MQPFLRHLPLAATCLLVLAGCATHEYSPNTYASNAVQYANKVEPGTVVGYRQVAISANGNIGAVTGGAAGGVLGSEYGGTPLAAVGGTAVGALVGTALDHAAGDTTGWEYIVRKNNGDMLSVTQREQKPLELGQKVLVIIGPQARVVPDYSVPPEPVVKAEVHPEPKAETKPQNVKVEVVLSLPPGVTAQGPNGQTLSGQAGSGQMAAPGSAPVVQAKDEPVPQAPAQTSLQVGDIQATTVSAENGQTVVVHLPVIGAVTPSGAGLVPVSSTSAVAAGTVTSEPEEGKQAPSASSEAPAEAPTEAPTEAPAEAQAPAPPAQN